MVENPERTPANQELSSVTGTKRTELTALYHRAQVLRVIRGFRGRLRNLNTRRARLDPMESSAPDEVDGYTSAARRRRHS